MGGCPMRSYHNDVQTSPQLSVLWLMRLILLRLLHPQFSPEYTNALLGVASGQWAGGQLVGGRGGLLC
jgi:hypothetical protein